MECYRPNFLDGFTQILKTDGAGPGCWSDFHCSSSLQAAAGALGGSVLHNDPSLMPGRAKSEIMTIGAFSHNTPSICCYSW